VVSMEALKKAVYNRVPSKAKEINEKALLLGIDIAKGNKIKEES